MVNCVSDKWQSLVNATLRSPTEYRNGATPLNNNPANAGFMHSDKFRTAEGLSYAT